MALVDTLKSQQLTGNETFGAKSRLSARQSLLKKTVCFIQDLSLQGDVRCGHTRPRFSSAVQGHHDPIHSELRCTGEQQGKENFQGKQRGPG